jgi:hypothetical protein
MKISVDVDLTPEEFRRTLGLPDVSEIQKEMVEQFRQQMLSGAEGYDPMSLMKPYLNSGLTSMEAMQKSFFNMMMSGGSTETDKNKK